MNEMPNAPLRFEPEHETIARLTAEVEHLRKYIDGERSRHLEIVVDFSEQVTKLTAELAQARTALEAADAQR